MKKSILMAAALLSLCTFTLSAQNKKDIVKTGYNLGPLPVIAYDADKGLQLGAILQLFDYGDGTRYPNYDSKLYLEASFFTKGSQLYQLRYDNKDLIPGVRWCSALRVDLDKAFDFYGFNGYQSYYDYGRIQAGKEGKMFQFTPFYRMKRFAYTFKSDFLGDIGSVDNLYWEAGIFAYYHQTGAIDYDNINKGKSDEQKFPETVKTLYDIYHDYGVISDSEYYGGFSSGIRLGILYDTRDKEGAPTRGIWAEAHVTAAPKFMSKNPYYRYSMTWRHYLPLVKNDVLTFAYRLNYEGTFGNVAPFYVLPYMTQMGEKQDLDGMGGFFTVRGIMRSRVVGLDMATYNAELRWRFVKFILFNQNFSVGLSAFSDGTMVTKGRDISKLKYHDFLENGMLLGAERDTPHITFGVGARLIMNENFIIAAEYGTPLTHFLKNSPLYNQDGTGAFYVNIGYLF